MHTRHALGPLSVDIEVDPRKGDGIALRLYRLSGLPIRFALTVITLTHRAEFGSRATRTPGAAKRILRYTWECSGVDWRLYCCAQPAQRRGVSLLVPYLRLGLDWSTKRQRAIVAEHLAAPCTACTEAEWTAPVWWGAT